MMPLVTIAITAYNYAHMLRDAIESARRQTYPNLEILVLDNASTDGTPALIAEYAHDPRVRLVRHPENIGMVANHNAAIEFARGEYLTYLSADDMLLPEYVRASLHFLQAHPECDLAYSGVYLAESEGHVVTRRKRSDEIGAAHVGPPTEFARLLADGCWIYFAAAFARRELYRTLGGFGEGYVACDYDLLLRWTRAGVRIGDVGRPLACARMHAGCRSGPANYVAVGGELTEFLDLLDAHVDETAHPLLDGFEHGILHGVERRLDDVVSATPETRAALRARAEATRARVRAIAATNALVPVEPRMTYIVLCDGPLNIVDLSMRSVLAQGHPDWELILVSSNEAPLDDLCAHLDPRGRIRALSLAQALPASRSIAHAVRIARGNAFTVLRAGATVPEDHAEQSRLRLKADPRALVVHPARVMLIDGAGEMRPIDNMYPAPERLDLLGVAPVVPIESLVCTRRYYDRRELNRRAGTWLTYWEMLLAGRGDARFVIGESRVDVAAYTGMTRDLAMVRDARNYARTLHAAVPAADARATEARARYLRDLDDVFSRLERAPDDPTLVCYAHAAFSGAALALPEAALAR